MLSSEKYPVVTRAQSRVYRSRLPKLSHQAYRDYRHFCNIKWSPTQDLIKVAIAKLAHCTEDSSASLENLA